MRQKIDITDVETATKIRAKYLRALENEEFHLLHGGTFARSFLRTYAQYLGLDAHRLLEEYRSQHEPREESEVRPIAPRPQSRRQPRGGGPPGRTGFVIGALVVALFAFLLVLGLTGGEERDGDTRAGDTGTVSSERETTTREPRERTETQEQERTRPARVRVRVVPTTPIYVCWDRGPGEEGNELPALAEPRTFRGRRIRLNLGNPSAKVTVDGEALALEGVGPFGFDLRPGRAPRSLPSGQRPCQ